MAVDGPWGLSLTKNMGSFRTALTSALVVACHTGSRPSVHLGSPQPHTLPNGEAALLPVSGRGTATEKGQAMRGKDAQTIMCTHGGRDGGAGRRGMDGLSTPGGSSLGPRHEALAA